MMIRLPSAVEDIATIDSLATWNEEGLRRTGARKADLYLYRHDLGLLYSFLERLEDGRRPASRIYQLARATQIASGGIGPPGGLPDTPTFDARIYSRLAAGYAATGQPDQAMSTLEDLVEAYLAHGLKAEAEALNYILRLGRRRTLQDRRREILDDPPFQLQDFTTEPPEPPR